MHVCGSPLHAFDRAKLAGGRIVVRRARPGEELRTLDGTLRRLDPADLLITDGEQAVALAAIMGGEESEVSERRPRSSSRRRTSSRSGSCAPRSGSRCAPPGSNRWEKGVDPYLAEPAAILASRLIVDLAGARMTGRVGRPRRASRSGPSSGSDPSARTRVIGLEVPARRAARDPRGLRVRGLRRLGRHRADLARTRRHARGRPDRGGRACRARPRPAHDAAAPPRPRAPERTSSGCAASSRTCSSAQGSPRRTRGASPRSDPEPGRDPPPGSDDLRSGDPAHDAAARARRCGADARSTPASRRTSRCSRSRASTCPRASSCPDERWRLGGIVEGGYAAAKGVLEALYARSTLELRVRRGSHPLLHPGQDGGDRRRLARRAPPDACSRALGRLRARSRRRCSSRCRSASSTRT